MEKIILDSDKYHINKSTNDGCITYVLKPKKRNCFVCNKQFESIGGEFLQWKTDKSNGQRYIKKGWFCKTDLVRMKQWFEENKELV